MGRDICHVAKICASIASTQTSRSVRWAVVGCVCCSLAAAARGVGWVEADIAEFTHTRPVICAKSAIGQKGQDQHSGSLCFPKGCEVSGLSSFPRRCSRQPSW